MLLQAPHYYDIFLLGLHWLSEDDPSSDRARSLMPILYTLVEVGLITEDQRRAALRDGQLRRRLSDQMYVCEDEPGFPRQETSDRHIELGNRHLAVQVYSGEFEPRRVLARNGYRMVLTNAGHRLAERKVGPYANIITQETFMTGYRAMRDRVSEMMRRRTRAADPTTSTTRTAVATMKPISDEDIDHYLEEACA